MNKKELSETDIRTKFITPAIQDSGWNIKKQVREEVQFTDGRIIVKGETVKRAKGKKADYILYYKSNLPIAIVEAKDNTHSLGNGMQQGLDYAEILDVPFVYSSNGDGFLEHDCTVSEGKIERELSLQQFPSPEELYRRYKIWKGLSDKEEQILRQDYYYSPTSKIPRYYQEVAINRTVEAIAKGKDRLLLVMATGTGKTYTAFQIMWRLWQAREKKRILFVADRNILVDDPMRRDFSPFGEKMTKINRGRFNIQKFSAYEIFIGLYQSITGSEESQKIYKQFPRDFFDLIVIDEAHRGSASDDSAWREILEYFNSATQVGMTATPKQEEGADNIEYFGEPIYTYSLKQGIDDGFLAPYRVIRVTLDTDSEGFRPYAGQVDKYGHEIPDEEYNIKDFDRRIVIDERTEIVAKKITEFLKNTDRFSKSIIFCVDIDHAERMRQALMNENADLVTENRKYVMRITGDNEEGKNELDNFIDPEQKYPVLVTTSKLLTTGIDAKTCKLIVLEANINSMTEFKQIIGRGTRLDPDFDKYFFTIMDFRQATKLFADPAFDGPAFRTVENAQEEPIDLDDTGTDTVVNVNTDDGDNEEITVLVDPKLPVINEGSTPLNKYYVNGVDVNVINETIQYYDESGKLTTESLTSYTKKNIISRYKTLNEFLNDWNEAEMKSAILKELEEQGIFFEELKKEVGKELDPFDMILHIAFDKPPLTRRERANNVIKRNYFEKYGEEARKVLQALLEKYSDEGVAALEDMEVLKVQPINQFGSPVEIVSYFGGREQYVEAVQQMEQLIYMET
ncbi:DEAD/DEAH box helicase family protein [Candidatus Dojkabacteria bacterium]|uniref:DEAD/DEAH box helicase family protein n=1 Tax=Candidatus Dojkabacteria bacterium TaxID=2099670 RepID=A0A955RHN2_9BACT|nr:DEAD/DEAH box helicase family protein [Candidatus Dojkabacteria bacterium]